MRSVLYTDPPWLIRDGQPDPSLAEAERGVFGGDVQLRFGPYHAGRYELAGPALYERARGCEVLAIYRCTVTPELLDTVSGQLKAVVRQGVGTDNLNAGLLAERGIEAFHVPDYCVDEVSTHTAALALALERRLIPQHQTLTGGRFDIYAGGVPHRVSGRRLGIVGFGRIGRAVARKLGVFYDEVEVYDPYLGSDLPAGYGARAVATLDELLERAHLVTLHCPLTRETDGLVDAEALRRMRPDAWLVNAARGRLVDPVALHRALDEGWIAGAALDVFAPEDPHDDPRWTPVLAHPALVATCHRAFLSVEAEASSRRRVAEMVRDILDGRTPRTGRVIPEEQP